MEPGIDIPLCPMPGNEPSDVIPMLVILVVFALGWWLFARLRKRRRNKRKKL